jgi:hypothetical protein
MTRDDIAGKDSCNFRLPAGGADQAIVSELVQALLTCEGFREPKAVAGTCAKSHRLKSAARPHAWNKRREISPVKIIGLPKTGYLLCFLSGYRY